MQSDIGIKSTFEYLKSRIMLIQSFNLAILKTLVFQFLEYSVLVLILFSLFVLISHLRNRGTKLKVVRIKSKS